MRGTKSTETFKMALLGDNAAKLFSSACVASEKNPERRNKFVELKGRDASDSPDLPDTGQTDALASVSSVSKGKAASKNAKVKVAAFETEDGSTAISAPVSSSISVLQRQFD